MTSITINNLSFSYDDQLILDQVTANFTGVNLLTGPSGSGKSTLLKLIAGLLPKYGGQVLHGTITNHDQVGLLFQDPALQFTLDTPRHELEFTLENCQISPKEMHGRIQAALDFANAASFADQAINTLSGGQQQRVALAVVMALQPRIILLDEPFANIDESNRQFILKQLNSLNKVTIIIVDHDPYGYQDLQPTVWQLAAGQLTKFSPAASQSFLTTTNQQNKLPKVTLPPQHPVILTSTNLQIKRGTLQLLKPTTLAIVKNKTTLVTGENGVGKSTLFKAFAKLISYQGVIKYVDHDIQKIFPRKYFQQVGLVFQQANDQFLSVTVREELALSIRHGRNPYFTDKRIQAALTELNLADHKDQIIYSLSGGQRKKLQLLLMLIQGQSLLLLDEPFAGLDRSSLAAILHLIQASRRVTPLTIILISHQLAGLDHFIDYQLHFSNQHLNYQGASS